MLAPAGRIDQPRHQVLRRGDVRCLHPVVIVPAADAELLVGRDQPGINREIAFGRDLEDQPHRPARRDDALNIAELGMFLGKLGVARFKVPEAIASWPALPKNDVGKVLKQVIRERLLARRGGVI